MGENQGAGTWYCRISVVQKLGMFWVYAIKNCSTTDVGLAIDMPDLELGNCNQPEDGGCYLENVPAGLEPRPFKDGSKYKFLKVREGLQEEFKEEIKKAEKVLSDASTLMDISKLPRLQ